MRNGGRGSGVRSYLMRSRQENGRDSNCEGLPRAMQFDESSDEYTCLCSCFHVKTGTYIVGGVEIVMILFFLIHSMLVLLQQDDRYRKAAGVRDAYVFGPFVACMVGLGIGALAIFLLFIGVTRNIAMLLIPHILVQALAILCFVLVLICGVIALSTDSTVFYRLLNAAPFDEHPGRNTVALDTQTLVRIYAMLVIYGVCLLLECWFLVIVYNCNRYLDERHAYMKYCLAFSTPMKTLSAR